MNLNNYLKELCSRSLPTLVFLFHAVTSKKAQKITISYHFI